MLIVIMAAALIATLAVAGTIVAVRATSSSGRTQLSGETLAVSNAGLAQGLAYMQTVGVTGTLPSQSSPLTVTRNGQSYKVWIDCATGHCWPTGNGSLALYTVHSQGTVGAGNRLTQMDVTLKPFGGVPFGVFGYQIAYKGSSQLSGISLFSTDCIRVQKASKWTDASGNLTVDPWLTAVLGQTVYNSAHSSNIVADSSKNPSPCSTNESIFYNLPANTTGCQTSAQVFEYAHDAYGTASFPKTSTCSGLNVVGNRSIIYNPNDLYSLFHLSRGLTAAQLAALKTQAIAQGNYNVTGSPNWVRNTVIYIDNRPGDTIKLDNFAGDPYTDNQIESSTSGCTATKNGSLIIVIIGANATAQSNPTIRADIFLEDTPNGGPPSSAGGANVTKFNGNITLIGSMLGDQIDLTGNGTVVLDSCSVKMLSPSLFDYRTGNYQEVDHS